eukprot:Em0014g894a
MNATADGVRETTVCCHECKSILTTKEDADMSSARDTVVPCTCTAPQRTLASSAGLNTAPAAHTTTQHVAAQRRNILYLIQTEQCIPPYFQLNDVFGIPNLGFEVIVLSYREACLESSMPHVQYLLDNSTTWTTGRNALLEAAMHE